MTTETNKLNGLGHLTLQLIQKKPFQNTKETRELIKDALVKKHL